MSYSFVERLGGMMALLEEFARQPGLVIIAAFGCFAFALVLLFCDGLYTRRRRPSRAAIRAEPPIAIGLGPTEPAAGGSEPDGDATEPGTSPAAPAADASSKPKAAGRRAPIGAPREARPRAKAGRGKAKPPAPRAVDPEAAWSLVRELLPLLGRYSDSLRPQRTRLTSLAHDGAALTGERLQAIALPEIRIDPAQPDRLRDLDNGLARRFLGIVDAYDDLRFAVLHVPVLSAARPLEPEWTSFFLDKVSALLEEVVRLVGDLQKEVSIVTDDDAAARKRAQAAER